MNNTKLNTMTTITHWFQGKSAMQAVVNHETKMIEIYRDGEFCQSMELNEENMLRFL